MQEGYWNIPNHKGKKWEGGGWETFHSKWRKRYKTLVSLNGGKPPPEVLILEDYQQCMEASKLWNGTCGKETNSGTHWNKNDAGKGHVKNQPRKGGPIMENGRKGVSGQKNKGMNCGVTHVLIYRKIPTMISIIVNNGRSPGHTTKRM